MKQLFWCGRTLSSRFATCVTYLVACWLWDHFAIMSNLVAVVSFTTLHCGTVPMTGIAQTGKSCSTWAKRALKLSFRVTWVISVVIWKTNSCCDEESEEVGWVLKTCMLLIRWWTSRQLEPIVLILYSHTLSTIFSMFLLIKTLQKRYVSIRNHWLITFQYEVVYQLVAETPVEHLLVLIALSLCGELLFLVIFYYT